MTTMGKLSCQLRTRMVLANLPLLMTMSGSCNRLDPTTGGGGGSAAAAAGDIVDNDKKSPKSKSSEEQPSLSSAAVSVAAAVCRLKVSTTRDFIA